MNKPPRDGRSMYWQQTSYGVQVLMKRRSSGRWVATSTVAPPNAGWLHLALLMWLA
jgi:hypothetical protein